MNENKSLLTRLSETLDQYRVERRAIVSESAPSRQPGRLGRVLHWFLPNGGTLLLVAALVLTANVWAKPQASPAAAPGPSATTVNYQGRLADPSGNPLDGTYGMTFALYDAPSGGNVLWSESHAAVPVSDGLFSVGLGSQTSGGIPTTTWNGDRYLETTVGGETLSPRELIRSVPVAGMALTVPDGAVSKAKLGSDVSLVTIQSGREHANYVTHPGWILHQGSGDRSFAINVTFAQSFESVPTVQVVLSCFDIIDDGNEHKVTVFARNVTTGGFELVFSTWGNSRVNGACATWIAHGQQ